jgi:hypothetical protein
MKNIFMYVVCGIGSVTYAQGVGINTSGSAPDPSAQLDVSSSQSGVLVPRIALLSRLDAQTILQPATSLVIFNTTQGSGLAPGFYYNAGTPSAPDWRQLLPNPANQALDMGSQAIQNVPAPVASTDAVNKAYVDNLVAASGGGGSIAPPTAISQQSANTMTFSQAVQYCETLVEGGQSDWRLPTTDEIAFFAGMAGATTQFLWTKTITAGKDFATNQNYISYRLTDGKWREGGVNRFFFPNRTASGSTIVNGQWVNVGTFNPLTSGNLFVITSLNWTGFPGGCSSNEADYRLRYNFPDGSFYYSPVNKATCNTSTFTNLTSIPILNESAAYSSIDLEIFVISGGGTKSTNLTISGYEISLSQKDGDGLRCCCIR